MNFSDNDVANRTKRTLKKESIFLRSLAETGCVVIAAKECGVARRTLYEWKEADSDFSRKWDEAVEESVDALEVEARRRALEGVRKPIFYKGVDVGGVQEYSDTLLIFLLKANRSQKYREQYKHEITGPGGAPIPFKCVSGVNDENL